MTGDWSLLGNGFIDLTQHKKKKCKASFYYPEFYRSKKIVSEISNSESPSLSCLLHLIKVD